METPLEQQNAELKSAIAKLVEENEQLRARVAELEEALKQNSGNSSKPPSSDPIGKKPKKRKRAKGKKRKPGGQPGHKGTRRNLLPPDQVDEVTDVRPTECSGCGKALNGDDPNPWRHQVTDLPQVEPETAEYRMHALACECGCTTRAQLPDGVPASMFGPRVTATIVLLTGTCRMSKRMAQDLLRDLYGLEISLGAVSAAEQRMSSALAKPFQEAHAHVQEQDVAYVDETGWRERGQKATLWVAVTAMITIFLIRRTRSRKAANDLLGEFGGVIASDRYAVYDIWPDEWKQYCWSHVGRSFQRIAERSGRPGWIGKELVDQTDQLFHYWHRARDGTISVAGFKACMGKIRAKVKRLLESGSTCGHSKTEGTCKKILGQFESLWTFTKREGVDPTNNAAERALRPAVIWRKTCFGTWSEGGSRLAERIFTVKESLRQQKRNVLTFLCDAYEASLTGSRPPSLLPVNT